MVAWCNGKNFYWYAYILRLDVGETINSRPPHRVSFLLLGGLDLLLFSSLDAAPLLTEAGRAWRPSLLLKVEHFIVIDPGPGSHV